jgi:hypothetical protein
MGQHVWLLLATILTELLVIIKWSKGLFPEPFPAAVKWGWGIGGALLILYPIVQVRSLRILILPSFCASKSDDFCPLVWRPFHKKVSP